MECRPVAHHWVYLVTDARSLTLGAESPGVPSHLMAKGWSVARAHSFTMLKKNPNTYFYRNVRPGEV